MDSTVRNSDQYLALRNDPDDLGNTLLVPRAGVTRFPRATTHNVLQLKRVHNDGVTLAGSTAVQSTSKRFASLQTGDSASRAHRARSKLGEVFPYPTSSLMNTHVS
jgi:hypothetical protein